MATGIERNKRSCEGRQCAGEGAGQGPPAQQEHEEEPSEDSFSKTQFLVPTSLRSVR